MNMQETYEGAYYAGDSICQNGSCGRKLRSTAAAAAAPPGHAAEQADLRLYWQGYMAGFYNNRCNQSAEVRTAAQAADRPLRLQPLLMQ